MNWITVLGFVYFFGALMFSYHVIFPELASEFMLRVVFLLMAATCTAGVYRVFFEGVTLWSI